ncbi:MAG: TIGR03905 family TSCPD domain-containing protein [Oscillospiraceae bacterium]|nr:TIGR03905 family TSCPD domain-containing protein [Oscillospiraceae bacterium]
MNYKYKTKGTCSREIDLKINDDKTIEEAVFVGGCAGNAQGITVLVKGMTTEEAIKKLKGIKCGSKKTSCPDQLTIALEQALESMNVEEADHPVTKLNLIEKSKN